jgi:type I restriction enzyme S subunit
MTKLEELINELCPDGVEYKTVGEVCTIKKGAQLNRDKLKDNGLYPVVNGGVNPSGYWDEYNFNANLITISQGGASAGYVNFMTTPFWAGAHCYVVEKCEECLNYTYLYHFIKMHQKTFMQCQYGAGIPSLSLKSINAIGIPLPPLSIQSEIVHILDSFTLLTAELTAELTARQKQYAFYRDYLLDFSDEDVTKKTPDIDCSNVEYIKLKDVCKIGDGLHSTPIYDNNGSYYFINGNNLENGRITFTENTKRINISQYERYKIELDDATILMSINGTIGKIALYNREPIILGKSVAYFNVNERILKKYLYYLLQTNRSNAYYEKNLTGSTIKNLGLKALREYQIPLPPIDVQKNIIKILDRFDKLNNDMSEGLPAEIEARKKQYEYYRDTLLSFDDKACSQIVKVERERELTRIKAIKWLKLRDIADIGTGSSNTNEALEVGKYPFFVRSQDVKRKDTYEFDETAIITSGDGVGVGKIFHFVEGKYALHQRAYRIHITDENVLPKYFFYYMKATFLNYIEKNSFHSSVTSVRRPMLNNYLVPVPPLEEQERIVSILDRFDKLCNDISEGLPAEIEARQKQYEYYRDKFLSFKEKNHA